MYVTDSFPNFFDFVLFCRAYQGASIYLSRSVTIGCKGREIKGLFHLKLPFFKSDVKKCLALDWVIKFTSVGSIAGIKVKSAERRQKKDNEE